MNALTEFDTITGEVLPPATGLYAAVAAQIDKQISTARAFPRALARVGNTIAGMVSDEKTAELCLYSLKRGGRTIQGPSARFAELLAYAYGHIRVDARLVEEGKDYIVVRGEAHDLQTNVVFSQDVTRRIVDSKGKRFDVDLISVTFMAAASIAQRDCILKVIPSHVWRPAFEAVLQRITGDVKTLADRRVKAIGQFSVLGVSADQVFKKLGVAGINDVTADHLVELVGTFQAIKAGDTTVEAEFGDTRITTRSMGGSPLAAAEDTSAEPVAETQAQPGNEEAGHTPDGSTSRSAVSEPVAEPTAPQSERAKPGPKPKAQAAPAAPAPALPPAAAPVTEQEAWATDRRLDAYERECVAARNPDELKAVAARWGATGYFEEMTESQKIRFDDIYDASLRALQLQARHRESDKAKTAYEAARNGAGGDSPQPAPKQPEPLRAAPEPPQASNGGSAFTPEIEVLRPTDPDAVPLWEECVRFLLAGENNADVARRMTELTKSERYLQLPETDQLQMRNVAFKIRKTKPL